uniref:PDZ domain-containing protein n=1 Tax=Alexandrium monilatum TaxID=311494 RepID=A0A7S4T3H0_9DINO
MGNKCCADGRAGGTPLDVEQTDAPFVISIMGARGLRSSSWLPRSDKVECYCEVKSSEKLLYSTRAIEDPCEPVWNEDVKVASMEEEAALEFSVYDMGAKGVTLLGTGVIKAKDYLQVGFNGLVRLKDAKSGPEAFIRVKVKVTGSALPPGPPAEFNVSAVRASEEESFGLRFDGRDDYNCQVLELVAGAFADYNAGVLPHKQVKKFDFIMSVNGITGASHKMREEFDSKREVNCRVSRSVTTSIIYDRGAASEPLGLEFADLPTSDFLIITAVDEAKHNAKAKDHEKLCVGDRIIAIGSVKCKPNQLQDKFKEQSGKVQLLIMRPAAAQDKDGVERMVHWLFE